MKYEVKLYKRYNVYSIARNYIGSWKLDDTFTTKYWWLARLYFHFLNTRWTKYNQLFMGVLIEGKVRLRIHDA